MKESQGNRPVGWAMSLMKDRVQLDVLKKDRSILRGSFLGGSIPGGQNENGLIVSQESMAPAGNIGNEPRSS